MALTETAGALGGLANATPYGAAFGAAAGVLNNALQDTPTSLTSGAGHYQGGSLVIGAKQIGGKGNSAGATSASQAQTTPDDSAGAIQKTNTTLYVIGGIVAAVLLAVVVMFTGGRKKKKRKD